MSDANVAAAITAAIRKMGQNFNEEILNATYALYRPLQERAPKDGVTVHKEIAYGDDERHRLAEVGDAVVLQRRLRSGGRARGVVGDGRGASLVVAGGGVRQGDPGLSLARAARGRRSARGGVTAARALTFR